MALFLMKVETVQEQLEINVYTYTQKTNTLHTLQARTHYIAYINPCTVFTSYYFLTETVSCKHWTD